MSSILTNNSAMVALQTLKSVNANLSTTQSEISTGKSVGTAKDNAAVWSISKVMESDVKGFKTISESLSLGQSTVAVGREAAETVTDLLTDIKGKIVSAQEGNVDRDKIQTDIDALADQIKSVTGAAQFNGLNLVNGTEDVQILSSLDRSSNGDVSASKINVERQDLSTSAGTFSNDAITGGDLTGLYSINDTTVTGSKAVFTFTEGTGAGYANAETITLGVSGESFVANITAGSSDASVMTDLRDQINGAGIAGISSAIVSGKLEITNTTSNQSAITIADTMADGSAVAEITELNGVSGNLTSGNINARVEGTSVASSAQTAAEAGKNATIEFKEGTNTGYAAGNTVNMTVGGSSFNLTLEGGETDADIVDALVTDINSRKLEGISATNDSGKLRIDNTNDFSDLDINISTTFSDSGTGGIVELNGRAEATVQQGTVEQRAETIEFSSSAKVEEGTGFQLAGFGDSFAYIAGKNETMEDVARGLKTAIDSKSPEGVEARVQIDEKTGAVSLAVGYDDADGNTRETMTLSASSGGEASGGLFGLDDLDVTNSKSASAALENIETMIQTSISAAAEFGSVQGRIETQSDFVGKLTDAMTSGIGAMVDTDMEETSAKLQALQVQQQLATQALSIANQAPQSILSLFR